MDSIQVFTCGEHDDDGDDACWDCRDLRAKSTAVPECTWSTRRMSVLLRRFLHTSESVVLWKASPRAKVTLCYDGVVQ